MLTLAIDTTAEFGSIGTRDFSRVLYSPEGFSGILFRELESFLAEIGASLADVDLFAAASGPGSFTGVRVGLAAAKGLAEAMNKPCIGISNLEALATFGTAPLRATVLDARRGEVFAALFDAQGTPVIPEQVIRFPHLLELLAPYDFEWISTNFDPFAPALTGTRFAGFPVTPAPRALASAIAQLATQRLQNGASGEPAAVEANYVRRSDAELLWREA